MAAQEQDLLRVLELLVQALEQLVRVTAQEMAQVQEQVLELALAVGLVQVPVEERVLVAVPDLELEPERDPAAELAEAEALVEVWEPGLVQALVSEVQEPELVQALLPGQ
jgi:hypothetical protein